eukprot:g62322.t1
MRLRNGTRLSFEITRLTAERSFASTPRLHLLVPRRGSIYLSIELTQEERMHHECNKLSRSAVLQEDDTKTGLGRYVNACLSEFVHSSEVIRKYMDVKDELKCIKEEFKLLDQDKEHFQAYLNREANSLASMRATALAAAGPGTSSQSLESMSYFLGAATIFATEQKKIESYLKELST